MSSWREPCGCRSGIKRGREWIDLCSVHAQEARERLVLSQSARAEIDSEDRDFKRETGKP